MNFYEKFKICVDEAGVEGIKIVEVPLELRPTKEDYKELERRIVIRTAETERMLAQSQINAQYSLPISQRPYVGLFSMFGGSERIRTSETVTRPHDFESCAFNHSATLPPPILSYFYPKNKATTIEHMVASLKILSCRFHIYVPEFPRPLFIGRILSVGTLRSPHVFGHLPYTFSLNFSTFRDR